MPEKFNDVVDKAQEKVDSLDKSVDQKFDVADAQSVIFAGVDNFQAKLSSMNIPQGKQDEYLAKVAEHLENITGKPNLQSGMKLMNELIGKFNEGVKKDAELQKFADSYLAERETGISRGKSFSDIEDSMNSGDLENHAYAPFLGHMLTDFKDKEWLKFDGSKDREKEYATKTVGLVSANLRNVKAKMEGTIDKESPAFKKLLEAYKEDTKIMAEIVANVGGYEAEAFRDPEMAGEFAREALSSMSVDEGIKWTKELMSKIDNNDWQSKGLQQVYGVLANTCRGILQHKLMAERSAVAEGDTEGVKNNVLKVIDLAKLFSNRLGSGGFERNAKKAVLTGGTSLVTMLGSAKEGDIDSDLCDPSWAAGILRETLNFEQVMDSYFNKQIENPEGKFNTELNDKFNDVENKIKNSRDLPEGITAEGVQDYINQIRQNKPTNVQEFSSQYAQLSVVEAQLEGDEVDQNAIMQEVSAIATEITEEFLDTGMFGADISVLEAQLGEGFKYSPEQREAYNLLKDIQGFGALDWSDKTWGYIKEGTKIAGMIAVGIAVGIATGGTGFGAMAASYGATVGLGATASGIIATGLAGGTAMTMTSSLMNQTGFDEGDFLKTYGVEFGINALGFGIGRGLNTARMAMYGDDALNLGTRMTAAGTETVIDVTTGSAIDIGAMSIQEGVSLQQSFAMFKSNPQMWILPAVMGGGFGGFDMGSMAWKNFKNVNLNSLPSNQLHGLNQSMKNMQTNRVLLEKDLALLGKSFGDIQRITDPKQINDIVAQLPANKQAKFRENFESYVEANKNLYELSKAASADLSEKGLRIIKNMAKHKGEKLASLDFKGLVTLADEYNIKNKMPKNQISNNAWSVLHKSDNGVMCFNQEGKLAVYKNLDEFEIDAKKISSEKLTQPIKNDLSKASEYTLDGPNGSVRFADISSFQTTYEALNALTTKQLNDLGVVRPSQLKQFNAYKKYVEKLQRSVKELLKSAEGDRSVLDSLMDDISSQTRIVDEGTKLGPTTTNGNHNNVPIKGIGRTMEKVIADYDGDPSKLLDLARGTLEYSSFTELNNALRLIKTYPRVQKIYMKDNMGNPMKSSTHPVQYRDVNLILQLENGKVVELQLHIDKMLSAKTIGMDVPHSIIENIAFSPDDIAITKVVAERIGKPELHLPEGDYVIGHHLYEIRRAIPDNAPPAELALRKKLDKLMTSLYKEAWKKHLADNS